MQIEKILSKSTDSLNRYLVNHTKMVANFGVQVGLSIYHDEDRFNNFQSMLAMSLALHDIGKCSKTFQKFISKKSNKPKLSDDGIEDDIDVEKYTTHNVYSWAYFISRLDKGFMTKYEAISSSLLFHHIVYRDYSGNKSNEILSNIKLDLETFDSFFEYITDYIKNELHIPLPDFKIVKDMDETGMRSVSDESLFSNIGEDLNIYDILKDGDKSLIRAILIFSDRIISSEKYDNEKILNNDTSYINSIINGMVGCSTISDVDCKLCGYNNERLDKQIKILDDIEGYNHTVIPANAGFGKTLIGLLWMLYYRKRKIIWVCPRNIICKGTYESIIADLKKLKQNNIKVALYYSGRVIKSNYNANENNVMDADILVTNIDNIVGRHINNGMSSYLYNIYNSDVIFDEFHEFSMSEPLFPMFIRLMYARCYLTNSKTLLLSATPINLDCFNFSDKLHAYKDAEMINGDMNVDIQVSEFDNLESLSIKGKDCFVITNTINEAQSLYRMTDSELLIHSLFTDKDRDAIRNLVYKHHDKYSKPCDRNTVIGTGIIGVGLDVSAHYIYEFPNMPEKTIQTCCGRGGRFNEFEDKTVHYVMCIHTNSNESKSFISKSFNKQISDLWIEEIKKYDGMAITKKELYQIYNNFYNKNKKLIDGYYKNCFFDGTRNLKLLMPKKSKYNKSDKELKYMQLGIGVRGFGNNYFITARDGEDNWCDPISLSDDKLGKDNFDCKLIRDFLLFNSDDRFEYPTENKLKYIGLKQKNDFNIENCKKFAYASNSPIPLTTYRYSSDLGLHLA